MATKGKAKKPYSKRTDLEKIKSNWKKTRGLYKREDWSAAIVRAATAVEIAANYVIRQELEINRNLENDFVDTLLVWANGIHGKKERLLKPLSHISEKIKTIDFIKFGDKITKINNERNRIVHSGYFKKKSTAKEIIRLSKEVIEELVHLYDNSFKIKEIK